MGFREIGGHRPTHDPPCALECEGSVRSSEPSRLVQIADEIQAARLKNLKKLNDAALAAAGPSCAVDTSGIAGLRRRRSGR